MKLYWAVIVEVSKKKTDESNKRHFILKPIAV
jgi:hypothetical protein